MPEMHLIIYRIQPRWHHIRRWTTANDVFKPDVPCYMRAISERFRDKELIIKRYINLPSLLYFFYFYHLYTCLSRHMQTSQSHT